jgi:hypothetical protein
VKAREAWGGVTAQGKPPWAETPNAKCQMPNKLHSLKFLKLRFRDFQGFPGLSGIWPLAFEFFPSSTGRRL